MVNRGHGQAEIERLLQQLLCYSVAAAPFNKASGGATFKPRYWWSTFNKDALTDKIQELALLLFDVVPHSAATERTFSIAGWLQSKTRNRMTVGTTGKLSAIKLHYNAQRPAVPEQRINLAAAARKRARTDAAVDLTAAAAHRGEVEEVTEPTLLDRAAADTDVIADDDAAELMDALQGAFDQEGSPNNSVLPSADCAERVEAEAEAKAAAAFKIHIYSLGVDALQQRLLKSWPGVDLRSDKLYPSETVVVIEQRIAGELGTNTAPVDIAALVANVLGKAQ